MLHIHLHLRHKQHTETYHHHTQIHKESLALSDEFLCLSCTSVLPHDVVRSLHILEVERLVKEPAFAELHPQIASEIHPRCSLIRLLVLEDDHSFLWDRHLLPIFSIVVDDGLITGIDIEILSSIDGFLPLS